MDETINNVMMDSTLNKKIEKFYRRYYKEALNLPNWQSLVQERLSEELHEERKIKKLESVLGSFKGKKILDVGCGTGGFVISVSKLGGRAYGIDPQRSAIEICKEKAVVNGLAKKIFRLEKAEKLSFPDNSFDIIYSFTVLEHVADVKKTMSEMIRVVKPGGLIYIHTPNYLSLYEGHYKVFWLPLFPKMLARIYLVARRRPTKFLASINYLTPGFFKTLLSKYKVSYKIIPHQVKMGKSFTTFFTSLFYKMFDIDPQIELIIKKN